MPKANAITLTAGIGKTDAVQDVADGYEVITSTTSWFSQSFVAGASTSAIKGIYAKLSKYGTPTGTFTYGIQGNNSGIPDGVFKYSQQGDLSTLPSTAQWTGLEFATTVDVTAGSLYHLVVKADTGAVLNSSSHFRWHKSLSDVYAGGNVEYSQNSGTSWLANSTADFSFETLSPVKVEIDYPKISSALPTPRKIYEDVRLANGKVKRYNNTLKKEFDLVAHFDRDDDGVTAQKVVDLDTILEYFGDVILDEYVWENKTYTVLINDGSGKIPETEILKKVVYNLKMVES